MAEQKVEPSFESMLEEHRGLRNQVQELETTLDRATQNLSADVLTDWSNEVSQKLVRLHGALVHHFQHEDEEGLLTELAERVPRAARTVATLQKEHEKILSSLLTAVRASMSQAGSESPEIEEVRSSSQKVLDLLDYHETRETELIQKVHYEDLGTGD